MKNPRGRYPSSAEFVSVWESSLTAAEASSRLIEAGYDAMTMAVVWRWAVTLREAGVRLRRLPRRTRMPATAAADAGRPAPHLDGDVLFALPDPATGSPAGILYFRLLRRPS